MIRSKTFVPLFLKFILAIVFIVLIFGSINTYLIYDTVYKTLNHETEKRGLLAAKALSEVIAEKLLLEDYSSLQTTVSTFQHKDESIKYIYLLDDEDYVLIHTFDRPFPVQLRQINRINNSQEPSYALFETLNDQQVILDTAYPILKGELGVLHVGIAEEAMLSDLQKTVNVFWIMVAFFSCTGILGAFVFANFITSPIVKIQNSIDNIDFSDKGFRFVPEIKIRENFLNNFFPLFRAEDEIDILCEKFNFMLQRLANAYETLRQTQSNLLQSEKLATIGTMASGIAHEINNPISGIQNAIERLSKAPEKLEQNVEYLNLMFSASERIEKIIKNLLSFSRKEELKLDEFDLLEVIGKVELLLAHKIDAAGIEIYINISEEDKIVFGSANHIEQVILNLMLNAFEAIQESGNTQKKITITTIRVSDYTVIEIEDTGTGIESEKMAHIFDPFFTTKDVNQGTGLGLAVSWQIINSHNGNISVESVEGIGTKFIIELPYNKGDKNDS